MPDTMKVEEAREALRRAGFATEYSRQRRQFIIKRKQRFMTALRTCKGELSKREVAPWLEAGEKWVAEHG